VGRRSTFSALAPRRLAAATLRRSKTSLTRRSLPLRSAAHSFNPASKHDDRRGSQRHAARRREEPRTPKTGVRAKIALREALWSAAAKLPLSHQPACWRSFSDPACQTGRGALAKSREQARGLESGSKLPHSKASQACHRGSACSKRGDKRGQGETRAGTLFAKGLPSSRGNPATGTSLNSFSRGRPLGPLRWSEGQRFLLWVHTLSTTFFGFSFPYRRLWMGLRPAPPKRSTAGIKWDCLRKSRSRGRPCCRATFLWSDTGAIPPCNERAGWWSGASSTGTDSRHHPGPSWSSVPVWTR